MSLTRAIIHGVLTGGLIAAAAEAANVAAGPNFHAVVPGRIYRSSQLSPERLEAVIKSEGIRTVVNLRGCSIAVPWYTEESRATHRLNVAQEDVAFAAGRLPPSTELRKLVEVFDRAEYPLLLHCRQGADRTGMASAVALLLDPRKSLGEAMEQLSLRYGHVAFGQTRFLDRFFELYRKWLESNGLTHSPQAFRRWVSEPEFPGECRCRLETHDLPASARTGSFVSFHVKAQNTGVTPWHFRQENTAGYHLLFMVKDEIDRTLNSGKAGLFNADVGAGEAIELTVALPPFKRVGTYRVYVDMLDERQAWFSQIGSEPLEVELKVHE